MTHDNTKAGRCDGYRIVDEAAFDELKKNTLSQITQNNQQYAGKMMHIREMHVKGIVK